MYNKKEDKIQRKLREAIEASKKYVNEQKEFRLSDEDLLALLRPFQRREQSIKIKKDNPVKIQPKQPKIVGSEEICVDIGKYKTNGERVRFLRSLSGKTRKEIQEIYDFPEASLKQIELNKYKLTPKTQNWLLEIFRQEGIETFPNFFLPPGRIG